MAKVIAIKCKGSRMAPLSSLEIVQGDLKELSKKNYEKLRQRIEEKGFDAPLFVWQNKILDGTQRFRVLGQMLKEGWELPGGMVPICDIDAIDLQEAKERLLGYISQYGKLTEDGLYEFVSDMPDIDGVLDSLDLPDFDMETFKASFFGNETGGESEGGANVPDSQYSIVIDCESESQQQALFERFKAEGLSCRVLTL